MTPQVTIETEWKRRMELVESPAFIELCVNAAKQLGITAKEWNENRAQLVLFFANEMCAKENQNN